MKKVLLYMIFNCVITMYAQNNNTGTIRGIIVDSSTHKVLYYATIRVYSGNDDKLVAGSLSDSLGLFLIDNLMYGAYNIKITYMGYQAKYINSVSLSKNKNETKLDTIKLSMLPKTVRGVEVVGDKPEIEFSFEKEIINVDKMPMVKGGTIIDIFRNTPSIAVEQNNTDYTVYLNGSSNIMYFIDGRISHIDTKLIYQMPANAVERVEIISNPTAKYDAEGEAGIINIVMRRNDNINNNDYNGMASVTAVTRDNYGASVKLNYKKNNINYYLNYNSRFSYFEGTGTGKILTTADSITTLEQGEAVYAVKGHNHNVELGMDMSIDSCNSVLFSFSYNNGKYETSDNENTDKYGSPETADKIYSQNFSWGNVSKGNNYDLSLNYKKKYSKSGEEITADIYYTGASDSDNSNLLTSTFPVTGSVLLVPNKYGTDKTTRFFMVQSDFVYPIENSGKVEAGIKGLYRYRNMDYANLYFSYADNLWEDSLHYSNTFRYNQYIYSAYAIYSSKLNGLGYKLGLRSEYTKDDLKQQTVNESYKKDYIDFFPTVNLSYKIAEGASINAGYSRRINRPDMLKLNPFIQVPKANYILKGNTSLKPEYVDNVTFEPNLGLINLSLYYRHTTDNIIYVHKMIDDTVQLSTYDNAAKTNQYGVNFYTGVPIGTIGRVNFSYNYFHKSVEGSYLGEDLSSSSNSWAARISAGLKLGWDAGLNLSVSYQGPRQTGQNFSKEYIGSNIVLTKQVFAKKGTIALSVNDPFKLSINKDETRSAGYYFYHEFKPNFTAVALSFSYSFDNFREVEKKWLDEDTGSGEYQKK